ncbi:hypothetical protein GUITHDRAFT_119696 [Guillardia theta CCMP2712]|uniref:Uncharacterized protein n=2 Tax=Guillardia theta TaxID=55529 RepID=L1IDF4_GUITC|nr:hypothetical protein GUITHDRAFT_119696 [Guillardia theta CCMP2712]EKX34142.1 hypothetical protein GUITHDRAFT_119696 [Guillardia theta CCMP2712]|eukprot:XP_005821122.1 hypothetical protein GUITHDRAFT_119696 [Guillardia theta CCMP2712]
MFQLDCGLFKRNSTSLHQGPPTKKRRTKQKIEISDPSLQILEEFAKEADFVYSKRSKWQGDGDLHSFLNGFGSSASAKFPAHIPARTFSELWEEFKTEHEFPPEFQPSSFTDFEEENIQQLFLEKAKGQTIPFLDMALRNWLKGIGKPGRSHEEQWKNFAYVFDSLSNKKNKNNKFTLEKFLSGFVSNRNCKRQLAKELRKNLKLQKKLKYIARSYMPDVNESCALLLKANMTKGAYNIFWGDDGRMHRLAVPFKKIGKCRVMKKLFLKQALKVFRTEQGCHGTDLSDSVKLKIVQKHLQHKKKLLLIFNTDATVLGKSLGSDTKHTEVSITVLAPRSECDDSEEWNEIEACVRRALDAGTLMILPVGDNAKNMDFNFWKPYENPIISILKNGITIGDNNIEIQVFFRADLAGHYGLLDHGGVHDRSGKFCLHCEETAQAKKAGKFIFLSEIQQQDSISLREFCKRHRLFPSDIEMLHDIVRSACGNGDLALAEMIEGSDSGGGAHVEQLLSKCLEAGNQQELSTCLDNPDKPLPIGLVVPCLRLCKISRKSSHLQQADFPSLHFLYCALHLRLRFVNLLVNYIYEVAANQGKVAAVNRILQSFQVNMELKNDKDQQRQLSGKMCKRFMNALPQIIDLLISNEVTRQEWRTALDEWDHVITVLSCQYYDKITRADAEELPSRIRSFCVKIVKLIGDVKRLQSFYFHSLLIGHIGEQFEYLYKEFGVPLGLLSLSAIEKRHETMGRRCYKKAIAEINLYMSGKSTSDLHPDGQPDSKASRSFYTLMNLLLQSYNDETAEALFQHTVQNVDLAALRRSLDE